MSISMSINNMQQNINPKIWGNFFWKTMHYITLSYPENPDENHKENVKLFFSSMQTLLPCENCRHHFTELLKTNPLTDNILQSKYNLINWLLNIHNNVNVRLNKKEWSYDEFIKHYSISNANQENDNKFLQISTILFLIVAITIIVIYINKSKSQKN